MVVGKTELNIEIFGFLFIHAVTKTGWNFVQINIEKKKKKLTSHSLFKTTWKYFWFTHNYYYLNCWKIKAEYEQYSKDFDFFFLFPSIFHLN